MDEKTVMDALVQMKRTGNLLNELWDLTQQLGQSIDRNDQVSTRMIVNMREDPLGKLQNADRAIREQLEALPGEDARVLAGLLNGGPPADPAQKSQQMLCEQVAANRRRLKQITELDRILSQRLGRDKSAYQ